MRYVYVVLSPAALPYAQLALKSLFENSTQPLDLKLITDSKDDRERIIQAVKGLNPASNHRWSVYEENELLDLEDALFGARKNLRRFRHGHPCWRKITDPLLLSGAGEELVLLDPDLYFPNKFQFEETPEEGVLLMWQQPNCLLPPSVVWTAMNKNIPLARHVDIGVAHWRAAADLDWLEWLLGELGGPDLPRVMHVEAIVWSAIAMRFGGGHLDPHYWRCWHRTPAKRLMRKLGKPGTKILLSEPWKEFKCFHAGGEAKWWLAETLRDEIFQTPSTNLEAGTVTPFIRLERSFYAREQALKSVLRRLGGYKLFETG